MKREKKHRFNKKKVFDLIIYYIYNKYRYYANNCYKPFKNNTNDEIVDIFFLNLLFLDYEFKNIFLILDFFFKFNFIKTRFVNF